eukprot:jgi/Undpi1/3403/HiC_scaffold_15.g06776.m1
MVSRLAVLVLGMAPAAVAADASASKALLRGSAPDSVMGFSRRGPLLTRGLADEDPMGGSYEHLGCYLDSKEDRILGSRLVSMEMTTMECHTHCDAMGAAYMATQYGTECWCSKNGLLDFERHGDGVGKCDSYCGGDEMQTCGGVNAFDLYRMEWAPASDSPEYKGCYMDIKNDRVMGDMMEAEMMTPVMCREHCMGKGVVTYATQFGNECWCGTSAGMEEYSKHGEGVCHMRCSGDNEIACGGYNSLSVYQMDDTEDGPTPAPSADTETTNLVDQPTAEPSSAEQQPAAVDQPTMEPTMAPSMEGQPTAQGNPTAEPSVAPVAEPTAEPSMAPVAEPTAVDQPTMGSPTAPVAEPTTFDQPTMGSPTAPVAEPTAEEPERQPTEGGGNAGEYAELFAIHNRKRCMHGANPLEWDSTIQQVAQEYADFLTNSANCGTIFHSDNPYGENLYYCGHSSGYGCYSDEEAMTALFDDELTNNVETWGLHATAIAWKSTTKVGCAVSTCEGTYYTHTLVCNFDPP